MKDLAPDIALNGYVHRKNVTGRGFQIDLSTRIAAVQARLLSLDSLTCSALKESLILAASEPTKTFSTVFSTIVWKTVAGC